jgi:hypothetical protein
MPRLCGRCRQTQLDRRPEVPAPVAGLTGLLHVPLFAGESSPFEELHGFSSDGVGLETSALPEGWRDRLVKVRNANTAAPAGAPCAFREKDLNFVAALLSAGLVDRAVIASRLPTVPHRNGVERSLGWLAARRHRR